MKQKKIPSFDELKDERYEYRYSRAERLGMRRHGPEGPETPDGGLLKRLFTKNRGRSFRIVFYVFMGLVMWFTYWAYKTAESNETRRFFKIGEVNKADVRLVRTDTRRGLNVGFENKEREDWVIHQMTLTVSNWTLTTNVDMTIVAGGFDTIFIRTPGFVSNIAKMTLEVK